MGIAVHRAQEESIMRLLFASGSDAVHSARLLAGSSRRARAGTGALPRPLGFGARARAAVRRLDALAGTLPPRLLAGTGLAAVASLIPLTAHYSAACAGKYAAAAAFIAVPLSLLFTPVSADSADSADRAEV